MFPVSLFILVLETRSLNQGVTILARLGGQDPFAYTPSSNTGLTDVHHCIWLSMSGGDLNSSPHA